MQLLGLTKMQNNTLISDPGDVLFLKDNFSNLKRKQIEDLKL